MRQLVLALYAEGRTDERFLPVIIQRTADRILRQNASTMVDVLEPLPLEADQEASSRAERIYSVARKAAGFHALIVHADADAPNPYAALQQRIEPGRQLVREAEGDCCHELLPIIPVRMTEAWMAADVEAFRQVVGTDLSADQLGFPDQPHEVEAIHNPKHKLELTLNQVFAGQRRRRKARLAQYYEPLVHLGRNPSPVRSRQHPE
ncbi:MAG: hypothetical protein MAG451_00990 [Anaerolineales bacterium]|nr:hypothetical protein [Anaerolineales bacterium]